MEGQPLLLPLLPWLPSPPLGPGHSSHLSSLWPGCSLSQIQREEAIKLIAPEQKQPHGTVCYDLCAATPAPAPHFCLTFGCTPLCKAEQVPGRNCFPLHSSIYILLVYGLQGEVTWRALPQALILH